MGLIDELGTGPIAVDTTAFIYFIENHATYADVLRPLFTAADLGQIRLVTSQLTPLEVLVVPYRAKDTALADRYQALLTGSRGLTVCAMDAAQLRVAAQLRAHLGMRTPDAIQLAVAMTFACSAFVTNDRRIRSTGGLRVLQLEDFT